MQIDYISDLHLDFYKENIWKHLYPNHKSEILIISGDLGHSNKQNIDFLKEATKHYPYVLFVLGNHDYYVFKKDENSLDRINQMRTLNIPGVFNLNGSIVNINGVNFGGSDGWYDGTYSEKALKRPFAKNYMWKLGMNDANFIIFENEPIKDFMDIFNSEYIKLKKIHKNVDVMISHVSPDWSNISNRYKNEDFSSFFFFDGSDLLKNMNGKHWVYGHTHEQKRYNNFGVEFYCNPYGYPTENCYTKGIKTFEI